jgi:ABC-2 type transport system ATP-binding protein
MSDLAVVAEDLYKTFPGGVVAVDGLDLSVPRGTVYGLIGRNGSGKTTTLRLLAGILYPERGSARILGEEMWGAPPTVKARMGYVSQLQRLHQWMTLEELCHYASHFYERWDPDHARWLAEHFELNWDRPVGWMSGGQQQKAGLALALAARPEVLILDEPAAGLDPIARRDLVGQLVDVIARGDGCTVLLSTHIMSDLERIAEHVGILEGGRLVRSGRLDELQSRTKRVQVIFEGHAPPPGFELPGMVRSSVEGPVLTAIVDLESDADLDEARRIPGARVHVFPLGLEDLYIELFGGSREDL